MDRQLFGGCEMIKTYIKIWTFPHPDMQGYSEGMTIFDRRRYPREEYGSTNRRQASVTYVETTDKEFAKKLIEKPEIAYLEFNGFDSLWRFRLMISIGYFMDKYAKKFTTKKFYEDELPGDFTTQDVPKKGERKINI